MDKVILYYKFMPIPDPETVMHWQRALCMSLGLKGRILISDKGLNGTLGGDANALKQYTRAMSQHRLFKGITYKWSDGSADHFPKLIIKVRPETVTLGWDPTVDEHGVVGGGKRLKPKQVHELLMQRPDAVLFDGRNDYESAIGKFKNAVTPKVKKFKEFVNELDKPEYESLKDKPVVTYCTGGIRCESLSALMKQKGFKEVYQMDGGVAKYGEAYGDDGLWEGKLFVFDGRMSLPFTVGAKDIAECVHCSTNTSRYVNCANKACNQLILVCESCDQDNRTTCSDACAIVIAAVLA